MNIDVEINELVFDSPNAQIIFHPKSNIVIYKSRNTPTLMEMMIITAEIVELIADKKVCCLLVKFLHPILLIDEVISYAILESFPFLLQCKVRYMAYYVSGNQPCPDLALKTLNSNFKIEFFNNENKAIEWLKNRGEF